MKKKIPKNYSTNKKNCKRKYSSKEKPNEKT